MKKTKLLCVLLTLVLAFVLLFALAACNPQEEHQHTYSENWTTSDTHHWHAATCGHDTFKGDYAEHSFGTFTDNGDGTCSATCSCGKVKTENHSFSSTYTTDNAQHWFVCTNCGVADTKVNHDYLNYGDVNGSCVGTCICGKTDSKIHQLSYDKDATHHWEVCANCDYETTKVEHPLPANWTDNGDGTFKKECVCGYVKTHGAADHTFGGWTLNGEGTKYERICSECGKKEEVGDQEVNVQLRLPYSVGGLINDLNCTVTLTNSGDSTKVYTVNVVNGVGTIPAIFPNTLYNVEIAIPSDANYYYRGEKGSMVGTGNIVYRKSVHITINAGTVQISVEQLSEYTITAKVNGETVGAGYTVKVMDGETVVKSAVTNASGVASVLGTSDLVAKLEHNSNTYNGSLTLTASTTATLNAYEGDVPKCVVNLSGVENGTVVPVIKADGTVVENLTVTDGTITVNNASGTENTLSAGTYYLVVNGYKYNKYSVTLVQGQADGTSTITLAPTNQVSFVMSGEKASIYTVKSTYQQNYANKIAEVAISNGIATFNFDKTLSGDLFLFSQNESGGKTYAGTFRNTDNSTGKTLKLLTFNSGSDASYKDAIEGYNYYSCINTDSDHGCYKTVKFTAPEDSTYTVVASGYFTSILGYAVDSAPTTDNVNAAYFEVTLTQGQVVYIILQNTNNMSNINSNIDGVLNIYKGQISHASSVSISCGGVSEITVGDTLQFTATVLPADAIYKNVTWSVDNTSLATITASGLLTAKGAGTVKVKATSVDGSIESTELSIIITPLEVSGGEISSNATITGAGEYYYTVPSTGRLSLTNITLTPSVAGYYKFVVSTTAFTSSTPAINTIKKDGTSIFSISVAPDESNGLYDASLIVNESGKYGATEITVYLTAGESITLSFNLRDPSTGAVKSSDRNAANARVDIVITSVDDPTANND